MAEKTKIITVVIIAIVALVVLLNIFAGTSNELVDSAEGVANPNNCSLGDSGHAYNVTSGQCYSLSNSSQTYAPTFYRLPLSTLFSPTGVAMIVVVIFMFLAAIFVAMKVGGKR